MNKTFIYFTLLCLVILSGCKKDDEDTPSSSSAEPKLRIKIDVDPTQNRLGNLGNPESIPDGHAAQNPDFNQISGHYLELAPSALTALGSGEIIYSAPETTEGGEQAIDFIQSILVEPSGLFLEIPLNQLSAGSYEWARLSLSYQNYNVDFRFNGLDYNGTLASFVGFNTYIENHLVNEESVTVNENKLQGYWAFETLAGIVEGQAPEGATTVPNPLSSSSPIPAGSCVVTGQFETPFLVTGNETEDIELVLSLSTNQSFEWVDTNGNGLWDVGPESNENVVDMGLRGLNPRISD